MAGERRLISEGPPIPSPFPLRLSHGPIRNGEQLSDGLITSALDFIMDFFVADQSTCCRFSINPSSF
ncbi:hypothetical protein CDAR_227821 [Caerostris darwini]|uniref:Uncharacterized protein n=1 Tax=Caerostris darwini TaxID=1538125 RepID=A0AAV4RCE1_9ARAC|nr:hypothetical protein CDAR_227821 [Caerostris darwini]